MAGKRRRSTNYLNNASLLEQIALSKEQWEKAKFGVNDPDALPSAAECMTAELVKMIVMLVDRYSQKANWRGYCVDEQTECLTKRGWLDIEQITTNDELLSYSDGGLVWSSIKSIFQAPYEGKMFRLTVQGMDALVTPGHKFMTDDGLKKVEYLKEKDRVVLGGEAIKSPTSPVYPDTFVELVGWTITEGNYYLSEDRNYTRVTVYQNEGEYAARIRHCLKEHGCGFSKYARSRVVGDNTPVQVAFHFRKDLCNELIAVAPNKIPTMDFLIGLTSEQRLLLINTMVDGDGWRTNGYLNYTQACKKHIDFFVALCTLSGYLTSVSVRAPVGYGKKPIYTVRIFSKRVTMVENIDFHGGKNINRRVGQSKETYPNFPTEFYKGKVWCPKTKYGCFMARRNGHVYLTGNTYIDDMKSEAVVSLLNGALKFKPEVSQNPFGYLTQIVTHSFLTTLDKEKRVRTIRDDILERNGFDPSRTRQLENEDKTLARTRRMADIKEGFIFPEQEESE